MNGTADGPRARLPGKIAVSTPFTRIRRAVSPAGAAFDSAGSNRAGHCHDLRRFGVGIQGAEASHETTRFGQIAVVDARGDRRSRQVVIASLVGIGGIDHGKGAVATGRNRRRDAQLRVPKAENVLEALKRSKPS